MSSVVISGDTSGAITLAAPAIAGTNTLSLPAQTATIATLTTPSFATTIGVGGATAAASGAGITFPASQSASSDANTLDDYEEGTWTPNDASGAGLSLTINVATYVKIGKIVILSYNLSYPSTANGSSAILGGLPFTVSPSTNNNWMGGVVHWNSSSRNLTNMALGQTTQATFRNNINNTDPTNANLSGFNFRGTFIYEAS